MSLHRLELLRPPEPRDAASARVGIVSPPFFTPLASTYSAVLLQALFRREGCRTQVFHGNIDFGAACLKAGIAYPDYKRLTHNPFIADSVVLPLLAPDGAATGARGERLRQDLDDVGRAWDGPAPEVAERVRRYLALYVEQLVRMLRDLDVVCLTATHFQLATSLLIAKRLKAQGGGHVALGGYLASWEAAKALFDKHPEIDTVVFGEGEDAVAGILEDAQAGRRNLRRGGAAMFGSVLVDHSSVFESLARHDWLRKRFTVSLEYSRGCYWDKCDFCNFNVSYEGRFKAIHPGDVLGEMDDLRERYGHRRFQLLDTAVPPRFPRWLAQQGARRDYDVFAEVRPDFTYDDLEAFKRLGRLTVQVGVESLSDTYLRAMNKNAGVASNIYTLTACKRLGIGVVWGLFVGHPKETEEVLTETLERIRLMHHLPPPKYLTYFDLRAGSPIEREAGDVSFSYEFPWPSFEAILPLSPATSDLVPCRKRVRGIRDEARLERLRRQVGERVAEWRDAYLGGASLRSRGEAVVDNRSAGQERVWPLNAAEASLLDQLRRGPADRTGAERAPVEGLVSAGLVMEVKTVEGEPAVASLVEP